MTAGDLTATRLLALGTVGALLAGCGGAIRAAHVVSTKSAGTTPTSRSTAAAGRAHAVTGPPHHASKQRGRVLRSGTASTKGTPTVEARTGDGAVLALTDGNVYSVRPSDYSTVAEWSPGAAVAVARDDESVTNLRTGQKVSVATVASGGPYSGFGEEHTLETMSSDGSLIVLNDHSIWEVSTADQVLAALWTADEPVVVAQASVSSTSYPLTNTERKSTVEAEYLGEEQF